MTVNEKAAKPDWKNIILQAILVAVIAVIVSAVMNYAKNEYKVDTLHASVQAIDITVKEHSITIAKISTFDKDIGNLKDDVRNIDRKIDGVKDILISKKI